MLLKKLVLLKLKKEMVRLLTLRMIPTIIYLAMKKSKNRQSKKRLFLTMKNLLK